MPQISGPHCARLDGGIERPFTDHPERLCERHTHKIFQITVGEAIGLEDCSGFERGPRSRGTEGDMLCL